MYSLLLAASLTFAQADHPPSPELVERFIAVLPVRERQPEEVDPTSRLNPGRKDKIRTILAAHAACTAPAQRSLTDRMLRRVAATLGTANVEALIRFYQGPDLARFDALATNRDLSAAERAELERLQRTYPVEAMMDALVSTGPATLEDEGFLSTMEGCDWAMTEAMGRASLRTTD